MTNASLRSDWLRHRGSTGPDTDRETKQEEALVVVVHLHVQLSHGACLLGSRWLWKVVLSVAGLHV